MRLLMAMEFICGMMRCLERNSTLLKGEFISKKKKEKTKSRWIIALKMKDKTTKLLEDKRRIFL